MAQGSETPVDSAAQLLDLGIELKLLTQGQVDAVLLRQKQLKRGGISLPIGQTLLERRFVTPAQLKGLSDELARRKAAGVVPAAPAAPAPTAAAKKFGQYELLSVLSEKGHSRVFKARDTAMNRLVVLKVLPKSLAGNAQWGERFKREMQLAGRLSHPNIITAYGAGDVDGNPLIALEFIEGATLEDRLEREGNLPEKVAWLIAREVAKGLAYAAANGVLHRDIKPENIMCGIDGRVKIIDMGFSKSLGDDSALTADGTTVGTPFYISPEQAHGTRDLDPRTDLYSLGCTVYHMLAGAVPFFGETMTEVMLKHTQAPRPDPREVLPEISEGSAKLVMRMIAINMNDRPASAQDLIGEIDKVLATLPDPVALIRPVAKVAPSDTKPTLKKDDLWAPPPSPQEGDATKPKGGLINWLSRLFR